MLAPSKTHAAALRLLEPMFAAELGFMSSQPPDRSLLAAAFDPDVIVHEPATLPYSGDWWGLDGVAALITHMGEVWSEMEVRDLQAVRDQSRSYVTLRQSAAGVQLMQRIAGPLQ